MEPPNVSTTNLATQISPPPSRDPTKAITAGVLPGGWRTPPRRRFWLCYERRRSLLPADVEAQLLERWVERIDHRPPIPYRKTILTQLAGNCS